VSLSFLRVLGGLCVGRLPDRGLEHREIHMLLAHRLLSVVALAALMAVSAAAIGCHALHQCPILQPMFGGRIPAPLPPAGDTYKVVGYRPGIRFYVIQYNDKIYRGGDILSREGADSLKALGIKTIVAVTPTAEERALAKEYGFTLVEIPFGQDDMTAAHLDRFIDAVEKCPAPVYVHCFGGDLRAAILVANYRIHKEGWSFDKALDEYRRLDANYWDSLHMVQVLKDNAAR
jgi:protein tyrosine phosphatase (PTP) superfamily phosphohydrolase (DUF442 family)